MDTQENVKIETINFAQCAVRTWHDSETARFYMDMFAVCNRLRVSWGGQHSALLRSNVYRGHVVNYVGTTERGWHSEGIGLDLGMFPTWLERQPLAHMSHERREAARQLWARFPDVVKAHWRGERPTEIPPTPPGPEASSVEAPANEGANPERSARATSAPSPGRHPATAAWQALGHRGPLWQWEPGIQAKQGHMGSRSLIQAVWEGSPYSQKSAVADLGGTLQPVSSVRRRERIKKA